MAKMHPYIVMEIQDDIFILSPDGAERIAKFIIESEDSRAVHKDNLEKVFKGYCKARDVIAKLRNQLDNRPRRKPDKDEDVSEGGVSGGWD